MPGHHVERVWEYNPTLHAPGKYRRACRYEAFIPARLSELEVMLEGSTVGVISEAEGAIRKLNEFARPALAPLARLLLRTESIASSKIEGMQMGVRALARAETKADGGSNISATAREVLANINAMELAVDHAADTERQFATSDIEAVHRRVMERAPNADRIAGQVRRDQNWIGGNDYNPCGAVFVPPPPEHVPALLEDLCEAVNDEVLSPVVQAALVHAQFETIHPFADGNGRTGRALIHVVLKRRGVAVSYVPPISVVLARGRDRYIEGLARFRGDVEQVASWIEQFATAAYQSADLAVRYLRQVDGLREEWKQRLFSRQDAPRAGAAAWVLLDQLPAHPIITAPAAAAITPRARSQVYEALDQLERAEVLIPVSESRRNRAWEVSGLLELLEGLEAGELPPERSG